MIFTKVLIGHENRVELLVKDAYDRQPISMWPGHTASFNKQLNVGYFTKLQWLLSNWISFISKLVQFQISTGHGSTVNPRRNTNRVVATFENPLQELHVYHV